jgi:hypothetical protein
MSKAFILGEAASGVSRVGIGHDLGVGPSIPDGGEPLVAEGILDDAGGRVRSALGDQHDIDRFAVTGDAAGTGRSALGDQHDIDRFAVTGDAAGTGRNALGDQHDMDRFAMSDAGGTVSREGSAFVTADEAGNDVVGGGADTNWNALKAADREQSLSATDADSSAGASSLSVSDSDATGAFMTADELGNDTSRLTDSADAPSDALDDTASGTDPWAENAEHHG